MSNLPRNTEPTQQSQEQVTSRKSFLLPPLPIDDLKVVFRPRDGLNLSEWPQHFIARAIGMAAQLTDIPLHQLTIRIRRDQNVAVVSTPDEEIAAGLQQITVLCRSRGQSHSASHIHNQQQEGNQPQGAWATTPQQQGKKVAVEPAGSGGKTTS
ncbi:hypothetical protein MTO96_030423, partial [Rhipicephalus appendiculatus]